MKYIYEKQLNTNVLDNCHDRLTRQDLKIIKRKWNELQLHMIARRMYTATGTIEGLNARDFFEMGYLAALCEAIEDTELAKSLSEEE